MKILKENLLMTFAIAIGFVFMSFNLIKKVNAPLKAATVTIFFDGNPTDGTQVADETRWSEDNPSLSCPQGNLKACSMDVLESDLNPSTGELDPAKISLNATATASGYIPTKVSGSGSNPIIHNRN